MDTSLISILDVVGELVLPFGTCQREYLNLIKGGGTHGFLLELSEPSETLVDSDASSVAVLHPVISQDL